MLFEIITVSVLSIPPLPAPHPSAVEKLNRLPNKDTKARILKSAENKAPIPDTLKHRFVEVESFETKSGIVIELEVLETNELVRLPGPSYNWPHDGCYMCLGNYMISHFGQSKEYLDEIGYENWEILYDNLHNDPSFEGVKGENEGWYGGGSSSYQRRGIFSRLRRR